jgi:hypothetical protein
MPGPAFASDLAHQIAPVFKEPDMLTHIVQMWRDDGLPYGVPMFNTETNAPGGDVALDVFRRTVAGGNLPRVSAAGGKASYYHCDF